MDAHLRDLRYFQAVAEELHFTRAAQRLFVSQPALSRQIAKLERDLRLTLLERDRRRVQLTPAGRALLAGVSPLLSAWDETRRAASDAATQAASVLRIGIQTGIGRGILATISSAMARTHPTWTTNIVQVPWDDPTTGLANADTDVALLWLPIPGPESFRWNTVAQEPRYVAMPTGHRLASRRRVQMADLAAEPFIALPEAAGPLRSFWLAEHDLVAPARIGAVASNAEETFEAVAAGLGVALVSRGNADLYKHDGITCRPVSGIAPAELALAWRSDDHRDVIRTISEIVTVSQ